MKTPSIPFVATLCVCATFVSGDAIAIPPAKKAGETNESPVMKIDLDTASRKIEKLDLKDFGVRLGKKEPVVSEYKIKELWGELKMQVFRVAENDEKLANYLVFLFADGKMNQLEIPTHGSVGLQDVAVVDRALYLTSNWGSGILRTALYRINRDDKGEIQTSQLGVLSSSSSGFVDKDFLKDKGVVRITNALRPIKTRKTPAEPQR